MTIALRHSLLEVCILIKPADTTNNKLHTTKQHNDNSIETLTVRSLRVDKVDELFQLDVAELPANAPLLLQIDHAPDARQRQRSTNQSAVSRHVTHPTKELCTSNGKHNFFSLRNFFIKQFHNRLHSFASGHTGKMVASYSSHLYTDSHVGNKGSWAFTVAQRYYVQRLGDQICLELF